MNDNERYRVSKAAMRSAFDKAADTYDEAALLQREVASRLDERLQLVKISPQVILDLGVGTGFSCQLLGRRYPEAQLLVMDIAEAMLIRAKSRQGLQQRLQTVCGDMEHLPLASDSIDLIHSNLTLQWCSDPELAFAEFARVLKPAGLVMFTTFGPDTLQELRISWSRADAHVHVNAFMDMHDIGDALMRSGLGEPVMDVEHIVMTYDDVRGLMADLKALGASNANNGRARSLTGKGRLQKMLQSYEEFRRDGRLPATYEVIYGHAWGQPAMATPMSGASSRMMHRRQAMSVEFEQYQRIKKQLEDDAPEDVDKES